MFLIRPAERYKETYIEGLREFQREGRNLKFDISELGKDFGTFAEMLRGKALESGRRYNRVPESIFWLIDNSTFIGRITIRHALNDYLYRYDGHIGYEIRPSRRNKGYGKKLLKLGLAEARRLGLQRIMISCGADNMASRKIIEDSGGIFENEVWQEDCEGAIRRYWIEL